MIDMNDTWKIDGQSNNLVAERNCRYPAISMFKRGVRGERWNDTPNRARPGGKTKRDILSYMQRYLYIRKSSI